MITININRDTIKYLVVALITIWFGIFLAKKIDLARTDIGRHLKNGEIIYRSIFYGFSLEDWKILDSNFYSYTHPKFPVVNHHWGSGFIFYLICRIAGFSGLSLFYIILSLLTFLIFFDLARRYASFYVAVLAAVLLIPIIAERKEIRPEVFTYFFAGLFFWLLWQYNKGLIEKKWLFVLPLAEIFWVNTHIYFIFGMYIICAFLFDEILLAIRKKASRVKELSIILALTLLASFINPFGIKGFIYPFGIFGEYGYKIVENQSIPFLENYGIINPNFLLFKITVAVLVFSIVFVAASQIRDLNLPGFILSITFTVMSWFALRNFTIFGFFAMPVIAGNINTAFSKRIRFNSSTVKIILAVLSLIVFIFSMRSNFQHMPEFWKATSIGLARGNSNAAVFFRDLKIQGPILNNYDIGGYLIFHLYPENPVFVDNRPEAYPVSFFQDIYIPLQEDESIFKKYDDIYKFNAVFFSHHDLTPWGQSFLIKLIDNAQWAPVYTDNYAIIFLKRNKRNQAIINKYEIPRERFSVKQNR